MIRRLFLAVVLLAGCLAASPSRVVFPIAQFPPYAVGYVTTTAATSFTNTPIQPGATSRPAQWLVGIQSVSSTAQTGNLSCYDNASAASGQAVAIEATMAAGQQITFPFPGIPLANGLTCISSAAVVGSGFQVQYL